MNYVFLLALVSVVESHCTEEDGRRVMAEFNKHSQELATKLTYANWAFDMSLSDEAANASKEAGEIYNEYQIKSYPELMKFKWKHFKDELLRRQFWMVSGLDVSALPKEKRANLSNIQNQMLEIYNTARVKEYKSTDNQHWKFIEDVAEEFATDYLDVDKMAYYWTAWHNTVGRPEKQPFSQWIELENQVAVLNHFKNNAEYWQSAFETKDFENVLANIFQEIQPLFKELHAYIRYKLWIAHTKNSTLIDPKGPIPAHLLGNMFGLDAINLYNITAPFPNKPTLDASAQLKAQNYTGFKMAKTAEKFYLSLGMNNMTESFWKYSVFARNQTNMDCTDVAYNFFNGYDYRIHFCTIPSQDDFGRMHHEMGHIENYMQTKNLPYLFQDAANPGFNEAYGDMVYLCATSPSYLKTLGLIDANIELDREQVINAIFTSAIADIFFLPYAYSLELWRWDVMKGEIKPEHYNCEYWKKRIELQGVEPPVDRDETDFDPGAKYHIDAGYQYISYFVSGTLKYQFLKALCVAAGYYDPQKPSDDKPLVFCDIHNSKAAGEKLKKMMALGRSRPWPDALEVLTGERKMNTAALWEYYQPLYKWLQAENKKNNVSVGWNSGHNRCKIKHS